MFLGAPPPRVCDTYSGSTKITTHLDLTSHCRATPDKNWWNRWTDRVCIINTRRDEIEGWERPRPPAPRRASSARLQRPPRPAPETQRETSGYEPLALHAPPYTRLCWGGASKSPTLRAAATAPSTCEPVSSVSGNSGLFVDSGLIHYTNCPTSLRILLEPSFHSTSQKDDRGDCLIQKARGCDGPFDLLARVSGSTLDSTRGNFKKKQPQ